MKKIYVNPQAVIDTDIADIITVSPFTVLDEGDGDIKKWSEMK